MNSMILFAQAAQEAAKPAAQQGGMGMLVPMLLIFAIFYFMMIRPQQRKEKERRKMIDELRAGAQIIFAGGLKGTITEAKEQFFMVEIAPGTVIEVAILSCWQHCSQVSNRLWMNW